MTDFTCPHDEEVTIDNVMELRDDRGVRPIKPFLLPPHVITFEDQYSDLNDSIGCITSNSSESNNNADWNGNKCTILTFPGDDKHDLFPGDTMARHRTYCRQPIGHGFKLEGTMLF